MDRPMSKSFETLKDALVQSPILVYPDSNKLCTLFMDASKYAWSTMLIEEHTTAIEGKTLVHQYPITFISGLFWGSQLN